MCSLYYAKMKPSQARAGHKLGGWAVRPGLFYSGGKERMPEETMIEMYKILSRFTVEERDRIVEIFRLLSLPCMPE